jgi:RHS repeat-associated protein
VVKSQRVTDATGALQAVVELDAWGGETNRSWQQWQQPHRYTSYERDGSGNDQAMYRQYHSYWQRFDQPDPYEGSYNLADPQSLNRYSYVQNDPVNFVDPSGLNMSETTCSYGVVGTRPHPEHPERNAYVWGWTCVTETWDSGRRDPPGIDDLGGAQRKPVPQPNDPCPSHIRNFFNELGNIFNYLKEKTGADVNHFAALSSYESGWLNQHNQGLHNPFGLTKGGGRNLNFGSYKEAADLWLKTFGDKVRGSRTIEEFATNLQKPPSYNTVNKDWQKKVIQQDATIQKFRQLCGV